MIDYNRKLIDRAKTLRKEMTESERHLWHLFLKTYPIKVYRQRVIENYIADFYCSKAKLIIELDGSGHYERNQMEYDAIRTTVFEGKGYHVIRFSNLDVEKNFYGVCTAIDMKIKEIVGDPPVTDKP